MDNFEELKKAIGTFLDTVEDIKSSNTHEEVGKLEAIAVDKLRIAQVLVGYIEKDLYKVCQKQRLALSNATTLNINELIYGKQEPSKTEKKEDKCPKKEPKGKKSTSAKPSRKTRQSKK